MSDVDYVVNDIGHEQNGPNSDEVVQISTVVLFGHRAFESDLLTIFKV